jgi:hypothetical protein
MSAAHVPDIVENDGIAGNVKSGESFEFARHGGSRPTLLTFLAQRQQPLSQNRNKTVTEASPKGR